MFSEDKKQTSGTIKPQNFVASDSPSGVLPKGGSLMKNLTGSASGGLGALADSLSTPTGLQFTLSVMGLPAQQFVVVDFSLTETFSSPYLLQVGLASADPAIDFAAVLDNSVTLNVWRDGVLQRCVNGVVASFEQGDTGFHQTRYSMVIRPPLWRTSLRRNSRIFQQQTPEEIITTLLRENGIVDAAFSLRHAHPAREFCVQYQESDFAFIQRLSAEEGMYYYYAVKNGGAVKNDGATKNSQQLKSSNEAKNSNEAKSSGETLIFADDAGTLPTGPLLPWNINKAAQSKELCVDSFRRRAQVRPASAQLKDYTFKNPNWPAKFDQHARELHNQRPDYEYYDFPGRFKDEQHGKDFTLYQLDGLRNDADIAQGQSNAFQLYPGLLFTLYAHPRPDLNTPWQIVSITHTGSQPAALEQESGEQGTVLYNHFSVIPAQQTWRPAPLPKPCVDGPQIAIVVGPPGEEIYCDDFGRVRVKFLWDRYAKGDDTSSCWIRVSQAWAGQGWGNIAIPRIGQEVIVDFLHGDPDQPIITGRTYHANNTVPNKLPTSKTKMSIRSKTHKGQGFNELSFEDSAGKEEVYIHGQKDMRTEVLNDRATTVGNNHSETVKANQTIHVFANQQSTIEKNQTTTVNQNRVETVVLTNTEVVGLSSTVTIGTAYALTVGGAMNTAVGLSQSEQVGIHKTVNVGNSLSFTAGDVIELTCGKSTFRMDKSGRVTISGTEFLFEANGPVQINGKDVDIN